MPLGVHFQNSTFFRENKCPLPSNHHKNMKFEPCLTLKHQNLIISLACHNDIFLQIWKESAVPETNPFKPRKNPFSGSGGRQDSEMLVPIAKRTPTKSTPKNHVPIHPWWGNINTSDKRNKLNLRLK